MPFRRPFEEVTNEINSHVGVDVNDEVLEALNDAVEEDIRSMMENNQVVDAEVVDTHVETTMKMPWALKYPARHLYDIIEQIADEQEIELGPYTVSYINRIHTSIVADLLYASAVIAKSQDQEEVDAELAEDTCEGVVAKFYFC